MDAATHLSLTLFALIACGGLGFYSYHLGTREHDKLTPRMMPWKFIAFGLLATAVMVLVHLLNLLGFETGR
ncbi:MAG: hypothetical protein V3U82_02965 [Robiginitomaculum sp.]